MASGSWVRREVATTWSVRLHGLLKLHRMHARASWARGAQILLIHLEVGVAALRGLRSALLTFVGLLIQGACGCFIWLQPLQGPQRQLVRLLKLRHRLLLL